MLLLGAGPVQLAAIHRARDAGFFTIAADFSPAAPGLKLADRGVVCDIRDVPQVVALAREKQVDAVCSICVEAAVRTVAAVAHHLGLPGLSPEAAWNATDKQRMRAAWSAAGVPSPISRACESAEDACALGWPAVIKPADSAGSRGVSFVDCAAQVPAAFAAAREHSPSRRVLVEQFMPGVEMSVEGFCFGGRFHALATSDKVRTPPPALLDTTVSFPSTHPPALQQRAVQVVAQAAAALGIDGAPIHAEVMLTPDGPMMVELAARGPGFKVFTEMIPWVTGIDVVAETIRVAAGESPRLEKPLARGAVLRFPEVAPGRVERIEGADEARAVPGIADLELYCQPGGMVLPLTSGDRRAAHLLALAGTRAEAEVAVRAAERKLKIVTSVP